MYKRNCGSNAAKTNGHPAKPAREAASNGANQMETGDADGVEFPLDDLPKNLADMAMAIAATLQVPQALPAVALLATVAASIGRGLTVESGPGRVTNANLYLLASAGTGVGKTSTINVAVAPFRRLQDRLRAGEIEPQFPMPEKCIPTLTVDDVTGAALPMVMADNGQKVFAVNAEAGDQLEQTSRKGGSLKSILLKGYSNEPIEIHRASRKDVSMNKPSITVLWMCQPHRLVEFLAQSHLLESGLLARFLVMHTDGSMLPLTGKEPKIPQVIRRSYELLVEDLFMAYFQNDAHPLKVRSPKAVEDVIRDFHNQVQAQVSKAQASNDRQDVTACICRWSEQAWRLALVLHAAAYGAEAHKHELDITTAHNAVRLARWFGDQQLRILSSKSLKRHAPRMQRLLRNLQDSPDGQMTFRDLANSHGFSVEEIEELARTFPDRFGVKVLQNPNGGPKSRWLCLADE